MLVDSEHRDPDPGGPSINLLIWSNEIEIAPLPLRDAIIVLLSFRGERGAAAACAFGRIVYRDVAAPGSNATRRRARLLALHMQ
jgi:hypothetical protein